MVGLQSNVTLMIAGLILRPMGSGVATFRRSPCRKQLLPERLPSSPAFCAQLPSLFACRPREPSRCPRTAPQRGLVVPSLQLALQALTAGYIGARIGAGTTGPAHTTVHIATAMERTSRIAMVDTRTSRIAMGMERTRHITTGTSRGGRVETAGYWSSTRYRY